ncbi:MAG: hypothetical protein ACI352_04395 [Elusimicrobiaceae bacterium]|nr:hypothetical protein [Elusimicrobiota bacterium]
MDSIAKFCVELEAVFNDGGLKKIYKDFTSAGDEVSAIFEELKREAQSGGDVIASTAFSGFSSLQNNLEDFCNLASESFGRLDVLIKNVWENMASSFINSLAKMAANNILASVFGGGGLFGGVFGGLLGSRRSGGPIDKTGPYYLHAGEFVLPPEVVGAIKGGDYSPRQNGGQVSSPSAASVVNITVNTPLTVNGSAERSDAQKLCEEISRAARRGVSWAVEQAKISYKIGRERSSESSL